jgi:hypothetical protein
LSSRQHSTPAFKLRERSRALGYDDALCVRLDAQPSGWAVDVVRALGQGNHVFELILGEHLVDADILESARLGGRSDHRCRADRIGKIGDNEGGGGLNLQ